MSQITLKNSGEELFGALIATITGYTLFEAAIWAIVSGFLGAMAAHFYKVAISPSVEKLINYIKSKFK